MNHEDNHEDNYPLHDSNEVFKNYKEISCHPEADSSQNVFCVRYCQEIQDFKSEAAKNKQILQAKILLNRAFNPSVNFYNFLVLELGKSLI